MPDETREKKRWPWWVKLTLALTPFLVLLVAVVVLEAGGRQAYKRALQEARAIGGPMTMEEIEAALKPWPKDRNGALVLSSLTGQIIPSGNTQAEKLVPMLGEADLPPLGEKWSEQTDRAVREHLAQLTDDLKTIDKLADCEGGRFAVKHAPNPYATILPSLSVVRTSCRLKSLQVTHEAMNGNTHTLVKDMDVLFKHGRLLADDPFLISGLVHVATDALALSTLERVLAQTSVDAERLRQIERMVGTVEEEDRLYWGVRGERAMLIGGAEWLFATGARDLAGAFVLPVPASTPGLRGWLMGDLAEGIHLEGMLVRAKTPKERIAAAVEMERAVQSLPRYRFATRALIPALSRAFELDLRTTATVRAARMALAAERYRLDKGRFPDKLDDLVPGYLEAVPVDPFDDKPMRYRIDRDAVIIYSVGDDKVDDGGKVQSRVPPKTQASDWGFALLKPEFRGRPPTTTAPAAPATKPAELFSPAGG
jgi:hypothetical protein